MRVWTAVLFVSLWGCAGGEDSDDTEVVDPCADAAPVTWDTFGQGFLSLHCQTCHALDAPNRQGAPASISFETEADAARLAGAILAVTTSDPPQMPPGGGVDAAELARLETWLRCFPPDP